MLPSARPKARATGTARRLLAPELAFRRASGKVDGRAAFLQAVAPGDARATEEAEGEVVLPERRHTSGQREGDAEEEPAGRHQKPGPPTIVEPPGQGRENEEQQPAQGVAERRLATSPGELAEERDVERSKG